MNNLKFCAAFFLCLIMAPQLAAADSALNRELIKKSGLEAVVVQVPAAMGSAYLQMEQHGVKTDDKFKTAWIAAAKTAFRADRIMTAIDKALEKLTVEERRTIIAYYDKPAGQRIRTLEEKASDPAVQAEIEAFAKKFAADPKNAERLKLYEEIDKATSASSLGTELGMKVAFATALGMINATKGQVNVDQAAVEKQVESQRPQVAQQMKQTFLLTSAYTYRDLSVAEINAYVKFLKIPSTKKFYTIVLKSLTDELETQARLFGSELAKNFKRKNA